MKVCLEYRQDVAVVVVLTHAIVAGKVIDRPYVQNDGLMLRACQRYRARKQSQLVDESAEIHILVPENFWVL